MSSYELTDVVERSRKYPGTFEVPSFAERTSLLPGDLAKLIFGDKERLWVRVVRVDCSSAGVYYSGVVVSEPVVVSVRQGEEVDFRPRHVAEVDRGGGPS